MYLDKGSRGRSKKRRKTLMLRKFGIIAVLSLLVTAFAAVPALAVTTVNLENAPQGAHFARGAAAPVCTVTGTTVTCTGTAIEGVGNTNATVNLDVTSTISGVCHNPGVNSKVVEPFSESTTTTTTSELTSTKNGRLVVPAQTTTGASTEDFLATFTCPNPSWTPEVTSNVLSFEYTLLFEGFEAPDYAIRITG